MSSIWKLNNGSHLEDPPTKKKTHLAMYGKIQNVPIQMFRSWGPLSITHHPYEHRHHRNHRNDWYNPSCIYIYIHYIPDIHNILPRSMTICLEVKVQALSLHQAFTWYCVFLQSVAASLLATVAATAAQVAGSGWFWFQLSRQEILASQIHFWLWKLCTFNFSFLGNLGI